MDKVLHMCLIHDLGECFTGDIPAFDKTVDDSAREEELLGAWVAQLPQPVQSSVLTCRRYCKPLAPLAGTVVKAAGAAAASSSSTR